MKQMFGQALPLYLRSSILNAQYKALQEGTDEPKP